MTDPNHPSADWNSRNYSAAGYFTLTGPSLTPSLGPVFCISTATGNAKQRRRQIREWKRQGWRVWQHQATGRWSSEVTDKER